MKYKLYVEVSETELYCRGQQNPTVKLTFLLAGPASGLLNRQAWSMGSKVASWYHLRDNSDVLMLRFQ